MKQCRQRALLATSDSSTRKLCEEALKAIGLSVVVVHDGVATVIAARDAVPDVILIDFQLRDVPGREAAGWLRANPVLQSTPIVMLNTISDDAVPTTAARPAMSLRRPLAAAGLQHAVRSLLT
jgi:CheY-like chemotaxis protein